MGAARVRVDGAEVTRSMLPAGTRIAIGGWSALVSRGAAPVRSASPPPDEHGTTRRGISPVLLVAGAAAALLVGWMLPRPGAGDARPAPAEAPPPARAFVPPTPTRPAGPAPTRTPTGAELWQTVRPEAARAAAAYLPAASDEAALASGLPWPRTLSCRVTSVEPQGNVEGSDRVIAFTAQYECDVASRDEQRTRVTLQEPGVAEQAGNGRWTATVHH